MTLISNYRHILGMRVDASNYEEVTSKLIAQAQQKKSTYACVANVHMCMEAYDDPSFQEVVNNAQLVTSDGMPLVIALRILGLPNARRVYGPDLTLKMCETAEQKGLKIALYGGTANSLNDFVKFLNNKYPKLEVACKISPPFRPLTSEEDKQYSQMINESGASILFVGIGCPRQEKWMADHVGKLHMVMLGVGAAFDFHSGRVKQAPSWMQSLSLEWLFRLAMEPKRLWKRYLFHNPRFIILFLLQYFQYKIQANK